MVMVAVLAAPVGAQDATAVRSDTPTLHVASRLVVLDAVVLDRNGKLFQTWIDRSFR